MRRALMTSMALVFVVAPPAFASGIVGSGLAFGAKEMCSCLFVMKQSLKDCKAYVDTGVPIPFRYEVEKDAVEANLFGVFKRRAEHTGARTGCRLAD